MTHSDAASISRRRKQLREALISLANEPLMRGSLVERRRTCGRRNCACAKDDAARHPGLHFSVRLGGRLESMHVRPGDEARLRAAIDASGRLWDILTELTECELADLRRQTRERRRSQARRRA
jgi:hypothetical protein